MFSGRAQDRNSRASGEDEAAFGLRDGTARFLRGFNPLLDDGFGVGEGLAVALSAGRAAGQFGNLGDGSPALFAPANDHFIPHTSSFIIHPGAPLPEAPIIAYTPSFRLKMGRMGFSHLQNRKFISYLLCDIYKNYALPNLRIFKKVVQF
jgi:hypothetical protein